MESVKHPRILIFGQPFNYETGGGITLSNLFKGWPKNRIAVLFAPWEGLTITADICDNYYQIGLDEHSWKFPFNIFKQPFPVSGIVDHFAANHKDDVTHKTGAGLKQFLAGRIINPFLNWLGLYHSTSEVTMSESLVEWLRKFNPDVLYLQVSSLEGIIFARRLIDFLRIPAAIHMMDDWPSTISSSGPLKKYWKKKIDNEFRQLLDKVDLHLSICDAMSDEYKIRYNKEFIPFHNPVETDLWLEYKKTEFSINRNEVNVLFSGRIGTGISESLIDVASAIDSYTDDEFTIKLCIQTTTKDHSILSMIQKYRCVVINPVADYKDIPRIFSEADILLLANDFSKKAISFLKFSMPTKASEFMISGTPVLVYSPKETAVSKFFIDHDCGYCVTDRNHNEIIRAILYLIGNEDLRKKLGNNAVDMALQRFKAENVRQRFQSLFFNLLIKSQEAV